VMASPMHRPIFPLMPYPTTEALETDKAMVEKNGEKIALEPFEKVFFVSGIFILVK